MQCLNSRIYKFVKYTKTLSVRNQHDNVHALFLHAHRVSAVARNACACPRMPWHRVYTLPCARRAAAFGPRAKLLRFKAHQAPPGFLRDGPVRIGLRAAFHRVPRRVCVRPLRIVF